MPVTRERPACPDPIRPALGIPLLCLLVLGALGAAGTPAAAQAPAAATAEEAPGPPPSAPSLEPERDAAAEQRLQAIFGQLDELRSVEVRVHAGVARLSGEVLTSEGRDLAQRLAEKIDGVLVVDNRITEVRDVKRRLDPVLAKVGDRLAELAAGLPLFAVALLVFLLFWLVSRRVDRWKLPFPVLAGSPLARDLARQALRTVLVLVGALLALDLLDATSLVGAVLGTAGLLGLAVGFAFRDTAENYIAGLLLSVRQPFAPNDVVEISGHQGKVVRLTPRATLLMTFEGNHVRIPNATVFKEVLVNYTRNPQRRFDFTVGVGTEESLVAVIRLGIETLEALGGVLAEPAPSATVDALGDSSVQVHFYAWVDQRASSFARAQSEGIRRVKEAFDDAGVSMPEPIVQVRRLAAPVPGKERPAPAAAPEPTPPELAISPETDMDRQIEADRAASGEADLLRAEGAQE
jgi:small-conductance mechanosensitive channel